MSYRRDRFEDVVQNGAVAALVLVLVLGLVIAWGVYQGGKLVHEAATHEPKNRTLICSAVMTVLCVVLSVVSVYFLIPAGLSLVTLLGTARMVQLQHTQLLERNWERGALLTDVLRERW